VFYSIFNDITDLLISVDKNDSEGCRLESPAARHCDVVAFTDVVDVNWDASVGANSMFLHQWNELSLREVVRRAGLLLNQLQLHTTTD